MISIIAAIGKNNELGKKNDLLWNLPADMKHFRDTTRGHAVIMGRKTFESIGRPLPNRKNVVITRDQNYLRHGVDVYSSLEEALNLLRTSPQPSPYQGEGEEIFIIGGAEIYKNAISKADKLYITHVDEIFPEADTFFPLIDKDIWQKTKSELFPKDVLNKYDMEFVEYTKKV